MLITLEGIECCGKTTQAMVMASYLNTKGINTVLTRQPGGCPIAEDIRDIVLNSNNTDMSIPTEMLLFAASYAQHVREVIKPALENNKIVISDRYIDSMRSYQGFGRHSDLNHLKTLEEIAFMGIMPDITFFLDIPVKISMERAKRRSKLDRIESEGEDFYKRIYEGYQSIHLWDANHKERIVRIDATQTKAQVWRQVCEKVDEKLFGNREVVNIEKSFERFIADSK